MWTKRRWKSAGKDLFCYGLGSALYAVGLSCFAIPNRIAPGGVSGIATMLNYLWKLPVGTMVFVLNIPLFLLGWKLLGRRFIGKTFVATLLMSAILDAVEPFLPVYQGDTMLASLFGGLFSGAGLALFFLRGATSGGTDILCRLLQRRWPFLSMGRVVLLVDLVVILASVFVFGSVEQGLYALIFIFVSSKVIDGTLYGSSSGKVVTVISKHPQHLAQAVTRKMERGVTILPVEGGYTGETKSMLYCAVRKTEVVKLQRLVRQVDPDAFMVISEAGEIAGEGFERPRHGE